MMGTLATIVVKRAVLQNLAGKVAVGKIWIRFADISAIVFDTGSIQFSLRSGTTVIVSESDETETLRKILYEALKELGDVYDG